MCLHKYDDNGIQALQKDKIKIWNMFFLPAVCLHYEWFTQYSAVLSIIMYQITLLNGLQQRNQWQGKKSVSISDCNEVKKYSCIPSPKPDRGRSPCVTKYLQGY